MCLTDDCTQLVLAKGLCVRCYARTSYQKNKEHKRKIKRDWVAKNKEYVQKLKRNNSLFRNYGITLEEYNQLLEQQGGGCALCGSKDSKRENMPNLVVDHNHTTGKVRGLLCSPCNVAIGMVNEDTEVLKKAIGYLNGNN